MTKKSLSILLLVFVLFSCSYKQAKNDVTSNKENTFSINDKFFIRLPENHSTGYLWTVQHDYNSNVITYQNSVFHSVDDGYVDFNFIAIGKGQTKIQFVLSKYKDTSSVKTFLISVKD